MAVRQLKGKANPFKPRTLVDDVAFVIGAEAGNVINVAAQLKDYKSANLTARAVVGVYLSDNADGSTLIATAPSGTVVIGTNGMAGVLEAKKQFRVTTNATGAFDLNITEAGVKTLYVVVVLPDGRLKVSSAVTFA